MSRWNEHGAQVGPKWLCDEVGRVLGFRDRNGADYLIDAWRIGGGAEQIPPGAPRNVASAVNVTLTSETLAVIDATAGNRVVTLPLAALYNGPVTVFKGDVSANTVTVSPAAGTVNGAGGVVLAATQWATLTFYSDGTNWFAG